MNNATFISKAAYEERVHRELHGVEHAKPYLEVLRKAASMATREGVFKDITFNKHGLAEGGPFVNYKTTSCVNHLDYMATE